MRATDDLLVDVATLVAELADPEPAAPTVLDVRWRLAGPPGRADHLAGARAIGSSRSRI
ncbi:hypothetical protein ACI2K4_08475 [Micromonospora sp. NPDC050397]|uniref:hypothetical protein n=1 Tax=Micromonospora sp. NPDC050397 TaxID=3364279 RepID=UPI00384BAAED